jgi:hypothetical protein
VVQEIQQEHSRAEKGQALQQSPVAADRTTAKLISYCAGQKYNKKEEIIVFQFVFQ